jgi:integrase
MKKINHHIIKRGQMYYFQKVHKGKRVKFALDPSLEKAREMRDELLLNLRVHGILPMPAKEDSDDVQPILAETVMDDWYESKKNDLAHSSRYEYEKIMNGVLSPFLSGKLITDITYPVVVTFLGDLAGISPKRKSNILIPLRGTIRYAKLSGYIHEDFMPFIKNKKSKTNDIFPFSMSELTSIIKKCRPEYADYFLTLALTGMRLSESVGLKWYRIDFNSGHIGIRETIIYGTAGAPKTQSSVRDIDMLPPVREALLRQKKRTFSEEGYVFQNQRGAYLNMNTVGKCHWRPALIKAKVRYRPMKQLRHTFATLMIEAGEALGWIQAMMGHENLGMIIRHYYKWIRQREEHYGKNFLEKYRGILEEV